MIRRIRKIYVLYDSMVRCAGCLHLKNERSMQLPRIAFGIQSFVVHVPEDTDGFFAFSFALENIGFTTTGRLVFEFNVELWRCWIMTIIL